jgi:hypothetical protein
MELSNEARVVVTDFVFLLLEGERRRKSIHLKFVEYIVDTDYNGPINGLSENITDMMHFHSFDTAFTMLSGKLGNIGMDKGKILSVVMGAIIPLLDEKFPLPTAFGVTTKDVVNVLDSLGEGREWRKYGKDN